MRWILVLLGMIRSAVLPSKICGCRRWSNHHNIAILNDLTTLYLPSPSAGCGVRGEGSGEEP